MLVFFSKDPSKICIHVCMYTHAHVYIKEGGDQGGAAASAPPAESYMHLLMSPICIF